METMFAAVRSSDADAAAADVGIIIGWSVLAMTPGSNQAMPVASSVPAVPVVRQRTVTSTLPRFVAFVAATGVPAEQISVPFASAPVPQWTLNEKLPGDAGRVRRNDTSILIA